MGREPADTIELYPLALSWMIFSKVDLRSLAVAVPLKDRACMFLLL